MFGGHAFVRQHDQSDCGAAALATICLHYKKPIGLQQMRDLAGTDRVGTNLLGLLQAAEKLGFSAKGVHGPYDALPGVPLPAVAHVKTEEGLGHFVVLYRADAKGVVVADPSHDGVERMSRQEFCSRWTGYLLILTPDKIAPTVATPTAPKSPWQRFFGLLRGHIPLLAEAFICAILMTLLGIGSSYFIQHLVDNVLVRNEGRLLNALGIGMVLILLFKVLFGILRQYLLAHVGRQVDLALIAGYAKHLLRLPLQFFELRRVGEIMSRIHDADKVREAISGTTLTTIFDGTLVVIMMVVLWLYDMPLAMVATAFVPLLVLSVMSHHPLAKRKSREAMEQSARMSSHVVEDISGVETIKAYGAERARTEEGESHLVRVVQTGFSLQMLGMSMGTLGTIVTATAGLVILWYGGHRVMSGILSIGQLMFFSTLLGYLLDPLERLASVNLRIQEAMVAIDRLYQILDMPTESVGDGSKARFEGLREGITLQDVCFRYSSRGQVLEKVNIRIPAGKTVAIVGESGSGKSTLLKLLMGFYHPTGGRVLFDGLDVRDLDLASLRDRIGLVSQDPFIFNGTIRENIALGRPEASLEDVIEAARAAGLEQFINDLPERYDTPIGERGANLSGGQRQRLAIARALVRKPDVLLFDEATSHLDTATERAIQESLKTALKGKTVVMVAHRLSTIREADYLYVMHEGKIVEEGTHRVLLAEQGWYAGLWHAQTDDGLTSRRQALNGHANGVQESMS